MEKENKGTNIKSNIKPVTKNIKLANTKPLQSKATASQNSGKSIKKEFVLEGLESANCATKIEDKVSKIKGISSANVNFVTKMLTLEIEEITRTEELISAAREDIKKMEPDVNLVEKQTDKVLKKILLLEGVG
jgi:Cd2+/Zn2+-exporting ATPase